ncbi:M48 family metalloprotease [Streptomyces sp. NPDC029721]|uniref:M48 family metalloprotease n=1 Tax=Streptomyces sp. NPDC029721 TaxID=3157090 RepID=UPI0033C36C83
MLLRVLLFWLTLTVAASAVAFPTTPAAYEEAALRSGSCVEGVVRTQASRAGGTQPGRGPQHVSEDVLRREIAETCPASPKDRTDVRAALAVGLLTGGGALLYWLLPFSTVWWHGLREVRPRSGAAGEHAAGTPCLDTEVRALASGAGVTVHTVYLKARDISVNAAAFGRWGRGHVEVTGGLKQLITPKPWSDGRPEEGDAREREARAAEDRAVFGAVVRHELGHIRNRDLALTTSVTALWCAFLAVVAAALVLSLTGYTGTGTALRTECLQLVLITGIVYAARNNYAHTRELRADAFSAGGGSGTERNEEALRAAEVWLRRLSAARPVRVGETSVWPFASHPSLARRRAALDHPALADEMTGWEVALIGCILGFALDLLLGHSWEFLVFAMDKGLVGVEDIGTLHPVYTWLGLPFLLLVGLVLGIGTRCSVLAWGGPDAVASLSATLVLRLAACLWAGVCLGCLVRPGPLMTQGRSGGVPDAVWQPLPVLPAVGLALTCLVTLGLCTLVALGCEAAGLRRRAAAVTCGVYGALAMAVWLPSALPSAATPILLPLLLVPPFAAAVRLGAYRRARGEPPLYPVRPGHGPGRVTRASRPMPLWQRLVCYFVTLGTTLAAVLAACTQLTFTDPSPPLVVAVVLGLVLHVFTAAAAALAPHDVVFGQRCTAAARCLAVTVAVAALGILRSGAVPPAGVLVLVGVAAGTAACSKATAAALYDLRHGPERRPRGRHLAGTAPTARRPAERE